MILQQGFIKLHRKIQNHWLYEEKRKFSKFEAWVDMLIMANHKDNKFLLGNELVDVKRGQFITSIRKLCDKWKWSNTKVVQFLDLLKNDKMIEYKKDTKKTVITIVKYSNYHDSDKEKTTEKRHENDTKATQKHTNKNVKNVKNDKKKYKDYVSMTEEEYQKLVKEFGEDGTEERMENLNLYKGSSGKKYKSDYLTILSWERKNKKQNKAKDEDFWRDL